MNAIPKPAHEKVGDALAYTAVLIGLGILIFTIGYQSIAAHF